MLAANPATILMIRNKIWTVLKVMTDDDHQDWTLLLLTGMGQFWLVSREICFCVDLSAQLSLKGLKQSLLWEITM